MLSNMSRIVDKDDLTDGQIAYLYRTAKVSKIKTPFLQFPKQIKLWGYDGKRFWFPTGLPLPGKTFREYHDLKEYKAKFTDSITLYDFVNETTGLFCDQHMVFAEALDALATDGTAFLHLSTGFGKSILLTKLLQTLGLKAAVLVKSCNLQRDMVKILKKNTTAKVCHFKTTKEPPPDTHIDVMGLMKGSKLSAKFLSRYQVIAIDEADELGAEGCLQLMKKIAPTYLIGLTATVLRMDGLHTALAKYWGDRTYFINRFIEKPGVSVIKYQTDFVPEIEYNADGYVRNDILENSISNNPLRQEMIVDLIKKIDVKMLVLSNRVNEIVNLFQRVKKFTDDVDMTYKIIRYCDKCGKEEHKICGDCNYTAYNCKNKYIVERNLCKKCKHCKKCSYEAKRKDMDKEKKILIGGYKSCGRGYDIKVLDALLLLTSYNNVKQFEGRLRSEKGIIYDFVDKAPIFEARWKKRLTWYRKRKMMIKFQIDGTNEVRDYKPPRGRTKYEEVDIL